MLPQLPYSIQLKRVTKIRFKTTKQIQKSQHTHIHTTQTPNLQAEKKKRQPRQTHQKMHLFYLLKKIPNHANQGNEPYKTEQIERAIQDRRRGKIVQNSSR